MKAPATALPWEKDYGHTLGHIKSVALVTDDVRRSRASVPTPTVCRYDIDRVFSTPAEAEANGGYIVHACNAYPPLVEALRELSDNTDSTNALLVARALLRKLGELE